MKLDIFKALFFTLFVMPLSAQEKITPAERQKRAVYEIADLLDGKTPNKKFNTWCSDTIADLAAGNHNNPRLKELQRVIDMICNHNDKIAIGDSLGIIYALCDGVRVYKPQFSISLWNASSLVTQMPKWMFADKK